MKALRKPGLLALSSLLLLAGCASQMPMRPNDLGVLVMAHGGSPQWNREVLSSIEPLRTRHNIEVAFGMADAASLQQGVAHLEERGARRIAVVRLFVSGESFRERTEQVLALAPGAPARVVAPPSHEEHSGGHRMEFWRIDTRSSFALSAEGLIEAPEMGAILAERARALSRDPQREDVLILAHGPGDDAENQRWLEHLEARAVAVRALPFRSVRVETLREDWPEKRKAAEERIRAFVAQGAERGGRAIVIPFRVQGFGPYAEVLKGLDYVSDGKGLIPSPHVTEWIEAQIERLAKTEFRATLPEA